MTSALAVDSSAIVAILNGELEADRFEQALDVSSRVIGWPTIFEIRLWSLRRQRPDIAIWLERFVAAANTVCVAFEAEHEMWAADAFSRFGKGRHPAALNFGDCMTYAVARSRDLPLLFKGGDFGLTDVRVHEASIGSI